MRLKLTVAYDGTSYEGWQIQASQRQPRTIQGDLEAAFYLLTGRPARVFGAGRTDAGAHALGQAAHVDAPDRAWDWRERLNAVLPPEIRVVEARPAPPAFNARKDAISKTYIYRLWRDRSFMPPRERGYAWQCGPVDEAAMRAALPGFMGRRDFASFQNAGTDLKTTTRSIFDISLLEEAPPPYLPDQAPMLVLKITGDGFLKQMVRNITGFLIGVGNGRLASDSLPAIFAAADRRALPSATAPARGLFLAKVEYGDDV